MEKAQKLSRVRQSHEGNKLWEVYCSLGKPRVAEFRALLAVNKLPYNTFRQDTEKPLGNIPAGRMKVYQEFFTEVDFTDFMREVQKPSSLEKKEQQAAQIAANAQALGLAK